MISRKKIIAASATFLVVSSAILGGIAFLQNIQNESESASAAEINDTDIASLVVACSTVEIDDSVTNCTFNLPSGDTIPTNFKLGIGNSTPSSAGCVQTGKNVACSIVPVGTNPGLQNIYGQTAASPVQIGTQKIYVMPNEDIATADIVYSPLEGTDAPLFKSNDDVTVTIQNLKTDRKETPVTGDYTCTIDFRKMAEIGNTAEPYTTIGNNVPYNTGSGCSATLTKAIRANTLSWSVRITITDTNNQTIQYELHDNYIFRFQGAGVIF